MRRFPSNDTNSISDIINSDNHLAITGYDYDTNTTQQSNLQGPEQYLHYQDLNRPFFSPDSKTTFGHHISVISNGFFGQKLRSAINEQKYGEDPWSVERWSNSSSVPSSVPTDDDIESSGSLVQHGDGNIPWWHCANKGVGTAECSASSMVWHCSHSVMGALWMKSTITCEAQWNSTAVKLPENAVLLGEYSSYKSTIIPWH